MSYSWTPGNTRVNGLFLPLCFQMKVSTDNKLSKRGATNQPSQRRPSQFSKRLTRTTRTGLSVTNLLAVARVGLGQVFTVVVSGCAVEPCEAAADQPLLDFTELRRTLEATGRTALVGSWLVTTARVVLSELVAPVLKEDSTRGEADAGIVAVRSCRGKTPTDWMTLAVRTGVELAAVVSMEDFEASDPTVRFEPDLKKNSTRGEAAGGTSLGRITGNEIKGVCSELVNAAAWNKGKWRKLPLCKGTDVGWVWESSHRLCLMKCSTAIDRYGR